MAVCERGEAEGATGAFIGLIFAVGGGSNPLLSDDTPLVDGLETCNEMKRQQKIKDDVALMKDIHCKYTKNLLQAHRKIEYQ